MDIEGEAVSRSLTVNRQAGYTSVAIMTGVMLILLGHITARMLQVTNYQLRVKHKTIEHLNHQAIEMGLVVVSRILHTGALKITTPDSQDNEKPNLSYTAPPGSEVEHYVSVSDDLITVRIRHPACKVMANCPEHLLVRGGRMDVVFQVEKLSTEGTDRYVEMLAKVNALIPGKRKVASNRQLKLLVVGTP